MPRCAPRPRLWPASEELDYLEVCCVGVHFLWQRCGICTASGSAATEICSAPRDACWVSVNTRDTERHGGIEALEVEPMGKRHALGDEAMKIFSLTYCIYFSVGCQDDSDLPPVWQSFF